MDTMLPLCSLRNIEGNAVSLQPPLLPSGVKATAAFDTFWYFACARQDIFFRRLAGAREPWSSDPILTEYKFTNVYRASDRVSQFLIQNVIREGDARPEELFFRIILFKLFNRIGTWQILLDELGAISWSEYSFERYDRALCQALERNLRIYSAAYIMPTGGKADRKHRHHLRLLEDMMKDNVAQKMQACREMQDAFELLRSYPSIGDFLAYQFVTDLNYSDLLNFSEMEFVKAGPGSKNGIRKCFSELGPYSHEDLIRWMVDAQQVQFERLGMTFRNLWGRDLQLIDCQNLFCEVDKYSRVAHPEIVSVSGRTRIKQRFQPTSERIDLLFPSKWGINRNMVTFGAGWSSKNKLAASSCS
jgi:hypothetical protein